MVKSTLMIFIDNLWEYIIHQSFNLFKCLKATTNTPIPRNVQHYPGIFENLCDGSISVAPVGLNKIILILVCENEENHFHCKRRTNCGNCGKNNDSYDLRAVHTCNFTIYTPPHSHQKCQYNMSQSQAAVQGKPLISCNFPSKQDPSPWRDGRERKC